VNGMLIVTRSKVTMGLIIRNGFVVEAPPIVRWMINMDRSDVWRWIRRNWPDAQTVWISDQETR
jgi:hypothetical protein